MATICPSCSHTLAEKDVDEERGRAICPRCGHDFRVAATESWSRTPSTSFDRMPGGRDEVPQPNEEGFAARPAAPATPDGFGRLRIRDTSSGGLHVEWASARPSRALGILLFALFWNGFLVVWYTTLASQNLSGFAAVLFFGVPIIFVVVGLLLLAKAVQLLLGHSTVSIERDRVTRRIRPLGFIDGLDRRVDKLERASVVQVQRERRRRRGRTRSSRTKIVVVDEQNHDLSTSDRGLAVAISADGKPPFVVADDLSYVEARALTERIQNTLQR